MYILFAAVAGSGVGFAILVSRLARHRVRRPLAIAACSICDGTVNLVPTLAVVAASPFLVGAVPCPPWFLALSGFLLCAVASAWNCLFFLSILVNRTTPYWDFASACARDLERYDVFISYKAEDAQIARRLADWLIAAGRRPWFDEYVIPRVDQPELKGAIERGISQSDLGIVMTNAEYAKSHWTRTELKLLVENLSRPNLFNLYSGDWPTPFPEEHQQLGDTLLDVSNRSRYEGSLEPVCSWLRKEWKLDYSDTAAMVEDNWFSLGENWEINLGQWKHSRTELPGQTSGPFADTVVTERVDLLGITTQDRTAYVNVICGKAPEKWHRELWTMQDDCKRKLQGFMKVVMTNHLVEATHASRFEGAHLIYVDEDPASPQFGFTYWNDHWSRRYSVVLTGHDGEPEELAFVFAVDGSFGDLCSLSGHIDSFVKSIRRKP